MAGEWEETTLADVSADVAYGYTESASDEKVGPRFLRITDIQNGFVNWHTVPYCPISESDHRKYRLHPGDIVVARTGNSTGENYLYRGSEDAVYASYLIRFRVNQRTAHPAFVWYNMRTQRWQDFINRSKTGSAQAGANAKVLGLFSLPLPPHAEQKAIAAVLGALDDKIELNRRMNATLEAMARALFQSWFVDFDPVRANVDRTKTTLPSIQALEAPEPVFPASFQDSELGKIPAGWTVQPLSALCSYLSRGIGPSYIETGGVLVLNQKCIRDHRISSVLGRRHDVRRRPIQGRLLKEFDILVNSTGVGTLGRVAQVLGPFESAIVDSHVTVVRAAAGTDALFLGVNLTGREPEIEELGEGSTGQTELSRARLGMLRIVTPPSVIQTAFGQIVRPFFEQTAANDLQSRTLATMRNTLLPKLLSGELRVGKLHLEAAQ